MKAAVLICIPQKPAIGINNGCGCYAGLSIPYLCNVYTRPSFLSLPVPHYLAKRISDKNKYVDSCPLYNCLINNTYIQYEYST